MLEKRKGATKEEVEDIVQSHIDAAADLAASRAENRRKKMKRVSGDSK